MRSNPIVTSRDEFSASIIYKNITEYYRLPLSRSDVSDFMKRHSIDRCCCGRFSDGDYHIGELNICDNRDKL